MVRPAGFEPAASWFVGKRCGPQGYVFNDTDSADMPLFGPFGVNWVGIWVGVFRGTEISTRPSGSARLGGSAQNPNLVPGPGGRDGHFTGESGSSFLRVADDSLGVGNDRHRSRELMTMRLY